MTKSKRKGRGVTEDPNAPQNQAAPPMEQERIAMRAYELYVARGGGDGQAVDDWLRAERELTPPPEDRSER